MVTEIDTNIGREVSGYVLNTGFSAAGREQIESFQQALVGKFNDAVWVVPEAALHITLMDWFAPLVQYDGSHDMLFLSYRDEYQRVVEELLEFQRPIEIHFDTIKVSPTAIFIIGTDDGSYARIRDGFLEKIMLLPGTKLPPKIIHASILRFAEKIDLAPLESFVSSLHIDFSETISEFRLVNEKKVPLLDFAVLKRFELN